MLSIYDAKYFDKVALSLSGYMEITDRLIQQIEKLPYCTVLDLSAGTGRVALKLSEDVFKVVVVDSSGQMLERISEKIEKKRADNIQVIRKDIAAGEFLWPSHDPILTGCAFNYIICSFVLRHINNSSKKTIIKKLRSSLASGGRMMIVDLIPGSVPRVRKEIDAIYLKLVRERENRYPFWFAIKRMLSYAFREHSLSGNTWEKMLEEAGYKDVAVETFCDFVLISAKI